MSAVKQSQKQLLVRSESQLRSEQLKESVSTLSILQQAKKELFRNNRPVGVGMGMKQLSMKQLAIQINPQELNQEPLLIDTNQTFVYHEKNKTVLNRASTPNRTLTQAFARYESPTVQRNYVTQLPSDSKGRQLIQSKTAKQLTKTRTPSEAFPKLNPLPSQYKKDSLIPFSVQMSTEPSPKRTQSTNQTQESPKILTKSENGLTKVEKVEKAAKNKFAKEQSFLRQEAKELEQFVNYQSIPLSRQRIKNLLNKLSNSRPSLHSNITPIQDILLVGTIDPLFTSRMRQAMLEHNLEKEGKKYNARLLQIFQQKLNEQKQRKIDDCVSQYTEDIPQTADSKVRRIHLSSKIVGSETTSVTQSEELPKNFIDIINKPQKQLNEIHTNDFYKQYKTIHKSLHIDSSKNRQKSPVFEYLKQVGKDQLLPMFMPIKKVQFNEEMSSARSDQGIKFVLDYFNLTVDNSPSLSITFQSITNLQMLSLVNTMLTDTSFKILIEGLSSTLISLNISKNEQLTSKSYGELHQLQQLKHLNVEQNQMGDDGIAQLLRIDQDTSWEVPVLFTPLYKINPEVIIQMGGSPQNKQKNKKQKISSGIKLVSLYQEIETDFKLLGLVCSLRSLNISQNKITDTGAKFICNFIMCSRKLQTFLMHWNLVRGNGLQAIAKCVQHNQTLQVLDVSFNSFASLKRITVKKPIEEKKDDSKGKKVTLNTQKSFNKLIKENGKPKGYKAPKFTTFESTDVAWKWRKTLMRNFTLLHLDISHNQLSQEDSEVIGDGLNENHTLLGLHTAGNFAEIDPLGFLSVKKDNNVLDLHCFGRLQKSSNQRQDQITIDRSHTDRIFPFDIKSETSVMHQINKISQNNCWVCQGYNEHMFQVVLPPKFKKLAVESVFIHLEFDNYEPMVMKKQDFDKDIDQIGQLKLFMTASSFKSKESLITNKPKKKLQKQLSLKTLYKPQIFYLWRMIPPSREGIKHFFSLQNPETLLYETFLDQTQLKQETLTDKLPTFIQEDSRQPTHPILNSEQSEKSEDLKDLKQPTTINITKSIHPSLEYLVNRNQSLLKAKPRQIFMAEEKQKKQGPWQFETSFFAPYVFDNEQLMHKCFEFDWKTGVFDKIIKDNNEREIIKMFLRSNYHYVRECYKHLSSVSPNGNVPSIGMNMISELMLKARDFVDYSSIKLSDVDLAFISTNAATARVYQFRAEECNNPERQLIRFQFLEILVRLAIERYAKKPPNMKYSEAVKTFFNYHMQPLFEKYSSHPWRVENYWNEECDTVIKDNLPNLEDIYNHFGAPLFPGGPSVIRLNQFIDLITSTGVTSDQFGAREIGQLYGLSMMTSVDEIFKNTHMDMKLIEFVEALARVADKALRKMKISDDKQEVETVDVGKRMPELKLDVVQKFELIFQQPTLKEKVIPETERNQVKIMIPIDDIDALDKFKSSLSIGTPTSNSNSLIAKLNKSIISKVLKTSQEQEEIVENEEDNKLILSIKLQRFIKLIATQTMGPAYAIKYLKDEAKRKTKKATNITNQALLIDEELKRLADMGLRARLSKTKATNTLSPKKGSPSKSPSPAKKGK